MKEFLLILISIPVVSIAQIGTTHDEADQHHKKGIAMVGQLSNILADSIAADSTGMSTLNSVDFAKAMVPGWNVGNSLEADGGETGWGNPLISQTLIDSIKAAGFKAIRIPIAWGQHSDTSFTINSTWIARVEQVINFVLKDSMYAIINEHWDNGWILPTYEQQAYVNNRLTIMWRQIAVHFRDYGDHLLFAGTNEVHIPNVYTGPTTENSTVQNGFNQTFVTAVRSTGGRNVYRYLAIQGYNTNIDNTYNYFAIPKDVVQNRLMVEVHYYDPYDFTINTGSTITQWGSYATAPSKTETWANESYADGQFQKMKSKFIDKGYAVILGEYGAMARLNLGTTALNAEYARYRLYYMEYITRSIERHGLVPFYWDNGGTNDFGMGLFNRSNGAKSYPDVIKGIIDTLITTNGTTGVNILSNPSKFSLSQNYPNPFNPSTTFSFSLPSQSFVSLKVFNLLGSEVATIVSKELLAGNYSEKWDASMMSSGIYFYRLQARQTSDGLAGSFTETKKLVLMR